MSQMNTSDVIKKLDQGWTDVSNTHFNEGDEAGSKSFNVFIKDINENAQKYFDALSKCTCCERHQRDRPTSLSDYKQYPFQGGSGKNKYIDVDCMCSCRHRCRSIVIEKKFTKPQ